MSQMVETLIINSLQEAEQRLDRLLTTHYPSFSRTYFQWLIENNFVSLNGKPAKKRTLPKVGDKIAVSFQPLPECSLEPQTIPLDIVYEDEHLIAINKPAGMVVHPAPGHWDQTFVNALLAHCQDLPQGGEKGRPGIVHRLDKETSGILLAAKTAQAHQKLIQAFAARQIKKEYWAICLGCPEPTTITTFIGRHPIRRKQMAVVQENGKEAITSIEPLISNKDLSLVRIYPKTGRTHQIRVHLKHLGHPILGDSTYGQSPINAKLQVKRQLLHAYQLVLNHPITQKPMKLTAPLPADFLKWIERVSPYQSSCKESFTQKI